MAEVTAVAVGQDEAQLLGVIRRPSPLETAMRLRALEEIARILDTSALVELAAQVADTSTRPGERAVWI